MIKTMSLKENKRSNKTLMGTEEEMDGLEVAHNSVMANLSFSSLFPLSPIGLQRAYTHVKNILTINYYAY